MKRSHHVALALGTCVLFAACGPTHKKTTSNKSPGADSELKPYPGSVRFCWGHVNAPGQGHISWEAYHSKDTPKQVTAHYTRVSGTANLDTSGGDATWRFPKTKPVRTLSVSPGSAPGPWKICKAPPAGALSVILISKGAN